MYVGMLEAYRKLGLLIDIADPLRRQGPGFIRMCLARAEAYRQQMPPAPHEGTPPTIVPTDELPLGPLEHIKLLHHKQLDRYLHGEVVDNKCGICDEPVCLKGPVFKMCECTEMYCRGCVLNTLASVNCKKLEDSHSYLSPDLPRKGERLVTCVQCPSCRSESYSVFGVEDARAEEDRLLRNQFPKLSGRGALKKKQNENGLYIDSIGDCCRQLVQEPRLHGEYEPLFPEASKTQLLTYVADTWLSSAQRKAARLCALLESGPGDSHTLLTYHVHILLIYPSLTLLIYPSLTLLIYFSHTLLICPLPLTHPLIQMTRGTCRWDLWGSSSRCGTSCWRPFCRPRTVVVSLVSLDLKGLMLRRIIGLP